MLSTQSLAEDIFQMSRQPMIVLDLDLRVKMANRAFCHAFQLAMDRIEGRCILELDNARWNAAELRSGLESLRSFQPQVRDLAMDFVLPHLGPRSLLLNARRIGSEGEDPSAILVELKDITEEKLAEQVSQDHTTVLEQSNSDLEQFAYVASHDLQEPLRMIASYTQLLAERYRGRLDADADEFIRYAVDGVHRMQSLIDGLLEYSRADRRPGADRETNCDDVLAIVQADLRQAITESRAVITSDPLPVIVATPRQIGQLFQNLVGNAIKFRTPGVSPLIHVSASQKNGDWLFSVKDNGIGIAPDQRGRLFQIFQRLHSRSEYPGTGIGLALCKKIVERHGGRVWLESEAKQGSTFFFTIPSKTGEKQCP